MGCNTSKLDSTSFEAVAESEEEQQSKAYVQHKYGSKGSRNIKGDVCFGLQSSHEMIRLLGKGGTGETWLCRNKQTDQLEAVKLIKRPIPKLLLPMIFQEIKIQADLGDGHLNIISSHEVILTPSHLALCMEYASGGSLTSYVSDRWNSTPERGGLFLSEDEARYFFIQFVLAVEYCHSHNVAHRDLKLDNTLLDNSNPPRLKICDFGFAKAWGDASQNLFTQIGIDFIMVYMYTFYICSLQAAILDQQRLSYPLSNCQMLQTCFFQSLVFVISNICKYSWLYYFCIMAMPQYPLHHFRLPSKEVTNAFWIIEHMDSSQANELMQMHT
eukprot:TRINITY_DN7162_c0_g1_i7.p1 TRINITY_DN7162_c0_g1~~TRINITY_DN7162_c0_g1_i7.p1  ORF type:complete len:328 (-),score=3.70 TRINITY_DN7162_c0_g1_i7:1329-2312(-)